MDFIERAKNEKLIALTMEGTRIADDMLREESEELVSKESMKIVSTTNRLVLADSSVFTVPTDRQYKPE